ncbi:Hypothetical predicted protein [Cloeon dipterum]|uniref:Uncharacterized protein n=1 Tax=Cloeon dipterum TaxID=197152 RepID=A0A8S1DKT6_9INSE|nr:Hypothetical predicted protein [Cloeon dipterum]
MTETCFVTQVRLLAALDVANAATQAKKQPPARLSTFFAAFAWPFLPQVIYAANPESKLTEKKQKEVAASVVHPMPTATSKLRQRKAAAMAVISAALAPLQMKESSDSGSNLPTLVLLLLRGLHSTVAKSVLGAAVASALLLVIGEVAACLVGVYTAANLPIGLYFMVAALGVIGFFAAQAILQDTASIQRRKSSLALLNR